MQLEERQIGDVTMVVVSGEITLTKQGDTRLRDKVVDLLNQGRRKLVLDLGGVTYADSRPPAGEHTNPKGGAAARPLAHCSA